MATTSNQNTVILASVGIDIGKEVFHLVGFDSRYGFCPIIGHPARNLHGRML